jgi:DNA repair protein RecO (recombination protein O)
MTRNVRRITLAPAYILHHRPFRDTSRILDVISRDYGRLSVFARGVRGPKAKLASVLQPFQLVLLSWSGRGESPQLTTAETADAGTPIPSTCLMGMFYLNELLLKLTTRHDPQPSLFDDYHGTVQALREGMRLEPALRIFEKRLLEALGYGLDLNGVDGDLFYHFRPAQGLFPTVADAAGCVSGQSLISLANEELRSERDLDDSRRVLQSALAQCLEGRALNTRAVAKAVVRLA